MTRLKKFLSATLMVLVAVFSYLGSAVVNVARSIFSFGTANAATEPGKNINDTTATLQGDVVSVPGFEKSIKKGESVVLPHGGVDGIKVTSSDLETTSPVDIKNVFVQIEDSYGEMLTTWVEGEGTKLADYDDESSSTYREALAQIDIQTDAITLTPSQSGTYKVKYYVLTSADVWTSTSVYDIDVATEAYSMVFADNDATVMPSIFNSETAHTIDLALPVLYGENGEVITEDVILGGDYGEVGSEYHYILKFEDVAGSNGVKLQDVTKLSTEDTNTYTEYKTYTVQKVNGSIADSDAKYALRVGVTLSDGTVYNNYDSAIRLESEHASTETGSVYDLNPYSFSVTETTGGGKHIVRYNLHKVEGGTVSPDASSYMTYTITGSKSFDEDNISIVASAESKIKSSEVSYREKKYLPKVNAVNSSDNNNPVNAFYYYKVQVESGDDLISDVDSVTMGRDEKGFYFIPKAPRSSYYDLSYIAIDAFDNSSKDSNKDDSYSVQIWDNNPPVAVFTTAYDVELVDQSEPDTVKNMEDISYVIPSKIATGDDVYIRIPALASADYSGLSSTSRRISSSYFLKDGKQVSSSKYMTITDATTGIPSQNPDIAGDINDYLYFVNFEGKHINAAGYLVSPTNHSIYVDTNGNPVSEENKVFAFQDEDGNPLTGTALRDAVNSCEAFVKLDKNIFGAGTYSLIMSAQDVGQNRLNPNRENKFELVDELPEEDKTTPTVEFGTENVANVGKADKVKLVTPTAKDAVDTRLKVEYYLNINNSLYEIEGKDGYLEFAMNTEASGAQTYYDLAQLTGSFKVVAFAFNDYSEEVASLATATKEELEAAHIGYDEFVISVRKINDAVPYFTAISPVPETPTQFVDFEVPGFAFHDDTNSVRVRAFVTDTNGNSYSYTSKGGLTITGNEVDGYDYVYGGIKFNPTNADRDNYYTVTYTLIDSADNVISYSVVLVHAVDKTGPTISGLTGDSATIELGQLYTFNKLKAVDNYSNSVTITADVVSKEGVNVSHWFNMSNLTFNPEETGTYTISLVARDAGDNPSQERKFTITVVDTLAPVITLNGASSDTLLYPESTIIHESDKDIFEQVELPTFSVSDTKPDNVVPSLFTDSTTGKVTVTAPKKDSNSVSTYTFDMNGNILNSVANTLEFKREGNRFVFTPTTRGAYIVTYSAQDASGNEATSSVITVNVGDTENPQIFLTSDLKNALEGGLILGDNASVVINNNAVVWEGDDVDYNAYSSFYVKDNTGFDSTRDTSIDKDIVTVTVKITDSNGKEVTTTSSTDNKLHYDFTTAGEYTLTMSVSDKVGNKETMTKKFVVSAKESSKTNTSAIIGTILIIVSAVILAGVVVYFIRGTKMLPKKNIKKSPKKED